VKTNSLSIILTVKGFIWRVQLLVDFFVHYRAHVSGRYVRLVYDLNCEVLFNFWNLLSCDGQEVEGNIEPDGVLDFRWKRLVDVCLAEEVELVVASKLGVAIGEHIVSQAVAVSQHYYVAKNRGKTSGVGSEFFLVFD